MRILIYKPLLLIFILVGTVLIANARQSSLTDQQVRKQIIKESIAAYPGVCPCPYSIMRNGRECKTRSAWSKPGGRSPMCYEGDISSERVQTWRESRNRR